MAEPQSILADYKHTVFRLHIRVAGIQHPPCDRCTIIARIICIIRVIGAKVYNMPILDLTEYSGITLGTVSGDRKLSHRILCAVPCGIALFPLLYNVIGHGMASHL